MRVQRGKGRLLFDWLRPGLVPLVPLIGIALASGCGGGPSRTLQDLKLTISPTTLSVGDNRIDLLITNAAGDPVTDASVSLELVHLTMQMPKNVVGASHQGEGHYVCLMNASMAGSWAILAEVAWKGQSLGRAEFQVQVRASPPGATPMMPAQHSH